MKTITFYSAVLFLFLVSQVSFGQEDYQKKIETLKIEKQRVIDYEKSALKDEVKEINTRLRKGEITEAEAEELKKEAAEKRALNIENKVNILENQIALLERNESFLVVTDDFFDNQREFFGEEQDLLGLRYRRSDLPRRDRRTYSKLVFAIGALNTIIEDKPILELPHQILGSKSLELGLVWKTRVFKYSNWLRFTYGISFQSNGLKTNNQLFVRDTEQVNTQTDPPIVVLANANEVYGSPTGKLKKSKFRQTDLIFPIHFEFGASKKREYGDYVRYSTKNNFKIGIGGYFGINLETVQKIKFGNDFNPSEDGGAENLERVYFKNSGARRKSFVGLSAYAGRGNSTFYIKYDLTPNFPETQYYTGEGQITSKKRNNISMGVRFEL
ncbi:MAG: hypothetical protein VX798_15205 [Bacteroidota bacterium]|uniref:Outer membrane protein beta-barrel domain-containing protein n=1 Tax=Flagellimonas profundi TaxID=2915620 RepID=A0ABS3FJ65_9FLAO|nr:hypothetical protein [Allomuricauda profundi]MBO0342922.1 hypothetical protein [Allomuricauda profundi]MEC7772530.1 hypothetical protein [Bacteroidota bacterium]